MPANLPALAPYSLWSRAVRSAKEASEIDDLRDAISKASSPAEAAEAKLKLFQAIYNLDKKTYAQEVEGLQLYEEVTGLWSDKREPTQVEALKDNEGFLNYLRTLGTLVSSTYKDAPEEEIASNLEKLNTALQRRNSVLGHAPTSATTTATPELTPTLAPTASATPAPAAPSTSTPPVPPAALVSALFSGGSRGKGGEAKIASAGSYGSWSSIFGGASAAKAGSPEPIRVIVEEPKSPLVWRALKFVAVTALYSFLLCVCLSSPPIEQD